MDTSDFAAPAEAAVTPAGRLESLPERSSQVPGNVANGVLVTGMHRSGTSAVAHVLTAAGLYPGPADDQMAATIENPRGYAELMPVMHFNDRLLDAKGWLWDAPPASPDGLANRPSRVVKDGRGAVRSVVSRAPWVLKDPRISLLLPEWRKILLDRFVVVFTLRPAAEVAWSLAVRNDVSVSAGLALWAAYYRHLCAGLNGLSAVAVDYVALATDPAGTTAQLLDALRGLGVDLEAQPAEVAEAVSPSLRRTTVPAIVEQAASAFTLEQVMPGIEPRPLIVWEKFDLVPGQPRTWEVDLLDERRARRFAEDDAERTAEEIESARTVADGVRADLAGVRDELAGARADAERARADAAQAAADLAALSLEREDLASRLAAVQAERDELAAGDAQVRNAMERMTNEVGRAREDNARLMEAAERAQGRANQLERLVNVYEGSTSWRLTAPLRRAGETARGLLRRR